MSAIAFAVVCSVKFVNSIVGRQQLFDSATKPIDVDSNSHPAPLSLFQFRQKCNHLICSW